jgi:hypothetical protein
VICAIRLTCNLIMSDFFPSRLGEFGPPTCQLLIAASEVASPCSPRNSQPRACRFHVPPSRLYRHG